MPNSMKPPCPGRAEALRLYVLEAQMSALVLDLEFRVLAAAPLGLADMGLTLDDVLGRNITDVVPDTEATTEALVAPLARGADKSTTTAHIVSRSGVSGWFQSTASYWHQDDGSIGGYFIVTEDVTAKYEAETTRRELETLLTAVVDNIPEPLTVQAFDTEEYLLVNPPAAALYGRPTEELIGRRPTDFGPSEALQRYSAVIAQLRAGLDVSVMELKVSSASQEPRVLRMKQLAFDDGCGRRRLLSIGEDITDLRHAATALEAAVAEAEAANAAKSRFLANVSHEIRTPLNGVLGMVQVMAQDELAAPQRERLQVIRQCGETLLTLLNDLLDLAKIEAGKIELESLDFDAVEAVRSACAPFHGLAAQKGVALEVASPVACDMRRGDPTRLSQIVANLVSNAVKFTATGQVEVQIALESEHLTVTVRDTGVGMAQETLDIIFDKFSQADVSTTRRFGGTGLGLAICRDLVELMGGRIEVASELGQGSCFTLTAPLPPATATTAAAATAPSGARATNLRVLAAEDNQVNRLVLKALLDQAGVAVTVVENGAEAIAAWEREPWDVILMDVQMPVLDGLAATTQIRRREAAEGRVRIPIIALTADAMAHHAAEYAACGMDDVVSKPILIEDLIRALGAVIESGEGGQQRPPDHLGRVG